jgi:hypothetical protein
MGSNLMRRESFGKGTSLFTPQMPFRGQPGSKGMRMTSIRLAGALVVLVFCDPTLARAESLWKVEGGSTTINLHRAHLEDLGLSVDASPLGDAHSPVDEDYPSRLILPIDSSSSLTFIFGDVSLVETFDGWISHAAVIRLRSEGGNYSLHEFRIARQEGGEARLAVESNTSGFTGPALQLGDTRIGLDAVSGLLILESGQLKITRSLAEAAGRPELAGEVIGSLSLRAKLLLLAGEPPRGSDENGGRGVGPPEQGPDVIVSALYDLDSYGSEDGISAFAVGTVSCNIGDQDLSWVSSTNEHPVIAQNMYRLKGGRFEQIGMSWLKHGFFAVNDDACGFPCDHPGTGTLLGPGCSDPYSAFLNGQQANLGPRWQVNAYTGVFPYPPDDPPWDGIIARRLQVHNYDLDPALSGGGSYFVEGQYVTADDAQAGNGVNNASYRPITVSGSGDSWTISLAGSTQQKQAAVRAWQDSDPDVVEYEAEVPGEGLFITSAKATDLGGGMWHYEYAVQNINSDRSLGSFSIPIPDGATVQNVGFHDVDYHSGEPFDGTDWPHTITSEAVTWTTAEDFATNPDANALRWGTLYNFRFDADVPPAGSLATLGLFKTGDPASITADLPGPDPGIVDCNDNGVPDDQDIADGTSADCNENQVPDECDIADGTSVDCDGGPVGVAYYGEQIFNTSCVGCHGPEGQGGEGYPGPSLRNKTRVDIWNKLLPPTDHPGGAFPDFTQEDFAALEAYLADGGSLGRPDIVPDECQTLADCDDNQVADGCDLEDGTLVDLDYDGQPDSCELWGDFDNNGLVELADYAALSDCMSGPDQMSSPTPPFTTAQCLSAFDSDPDDDIDLIDASEFTRLFGGS